MCVSMSTQQIAIFGDKLVVRREKLRWEVRDLVVDDESLVSFNLNISQDSLQ